jgi:hypothetical protein
MVPNAATHITAQGGRISKAPKSGASPTVSEAPYRVFIGESDDKKVKTRRISPRETTSSVHAWISWGACKTVVRMARPRPMTATANE